jgi:hypothetical protein
VNFEGEGIEIESNIDVRQGSCEGPGMVCWMQVGCKSLSFMTTISNGKLKEPDPNLMQQGLS